MWSNISSFLRKPIIFAFLICLFGCYHEEHKPLRIGTNLWIGYEPLYLAEELGYFKDNSVSLTEMPSASDVIRAFRQNMIDCAALTLDESYLLLQDGIDIKILFIMDISDGADILLAKPEIDSLHELKGKKVAVENSAVGAYFLCRALEFAELKPSDIQIVTHIVSGHEQAYKSGEVDAVVTFEPTRTKLIAVGANVLIDSKAIPNEIFDVLVVRADLCQTRKKELEELTDNWFKALRYIETNQKPAAKYISKRLGITDDQFIKSLEGIKLPDRTENDDILQNEFIKSANHILDVMIKKNLLEERIDPKKLLITNKGGAGILK